MVLESGVGILSRFDVPLYTVAGAARYLEVPESTLHLGTHLPAVGSSHSIQVSGAAGRGGTEARRWPG